MKSIKKITKNKMEKKNCKALDSDKTCIDGILRYNNDCKDDRKNFENCFKERKCKEKK